jgi:hypothetical protein
MNTGVGQNQHVGGGNNIPQQQGDSSGINNANQQQQPPIPSGGNNVGSSGNSSAPGNNQPPVPSSSNQDNQNDNNKSNAGSGTNSNSGSGVASTLQKLQEELNRLRSENGKMQENLKNRDVELSIYQTAAQKGVTAASAPEVQKKLVELRKQQVENAVQRAQFLINDFSKWGENVPAEVSGPLNYLKKSVEKLATGQLDMSKAEHQRILDDAINTTNVLNHIKQFGETRVSQERAKAEQYQKELAQRDAAIKNLQAQFNNANSELEVVKRHMELFSNGKSNPNTSSSVQQTGSVPYGSLPANTGNGQQQQQQQQQPMGIPNQPLGGGMNRQQQQQQPNGQKMPNPLKPMEWLQGNNPVANYFGFNSQMVRSLAAEGMKVEDDDGEPPVFASMSGNSHVGEKRSRDQSGLDTKQSVASFDYGSVPPSRFNNHLPNKRRHQTRQIWVGPRPRHIIGSFVEQSVVEAANMKGGKEFNMLFGNLGASLKNQGLPSAMPPGIEEIPYQEALERNQRIFSRGPSAFSM